jgi:uncharacterized protein (TIGR03067 family)
MATIVRSGNVLAERSAMRLSIVLIIATSLLAAEPAPAQDAKKEQALFEGTWLVVSRELMGKKASEEELKNLNTKVVIKDDKITVWGADAGKDEVLAEFTFKVDPTAKPRAIDLMGTSGVQKDKTVLGIYEFAGDTLKVCFAPPMEKRPTEFAAAKDSEWLLVVYKREKK